MSGEEVICPKCGGVIDKKTLRCNNCGTQYTREEYEELKNEMRLKRWLIGKEVEGELLNIFEEDRGEKESGELMVVSMPSSSEEGVDVDSLIQENIKLKSLVEAHLAKREELEEEIERLKKEIEILKQEAIKPLPQELRDLKLKEMELKEREIKLEMLEKKMLLSMGTKESYRELDKIFDEIKKNVSDERVDELVKKIEELTKELMERDRIISELKNELQLKEDEMKKFQEMLKYKEEELTRREEELLFREKKIEKELRDLEMARSELSHLDELALKRRLEDLEEEIKRKEEELRIKEKYLRAKERELEAKMKGLVEEEVELAEEEIKAEISERKVKTGTRRLDDLLYGGIPIGSNVLIYGPPYSKKEVLVYSFIAEGANTAHDDLPLPSDVFLLLKACTYGIHLPEFLPRSQCLCHMYGLCPQFQAPAWAHLIWPSVNEPSVIPLLLAVTSIQFLLCTSVIPCTHKNVLWASILNSIIPSIK